MQRRHLLLALAAAPLAGLSQLGWARSSTAQAGLALGATWRGPRVEDPGLVGVLSFDLQAGHIRVVWSQPLPGRAHGLLAARDGGLVVVAVRPGRWLQRYDARGALSRSVELDPASSRSLTGHVVESRDRRWLYCGETDARDDSGWISVRDAATLERVAEWPTLGIEPHDLTLVPDGSLIVANGGIRRGAKDAKRDLSRMDSSLVQLDPASGRVRGHWRLDDARLSLRHLAWSDPQGGEVLLGIGLQAEHDDRQQRREAPVLAVWNGATLSMPTRSAEAVGYAGDIAAAPGGGFVLTSHRVDQALWWHPSRPARLTTVARLSEAYAVSASRHDDTTDAVLICAAKGAARWHPTQAGTLLPWPEPMAIDNHWVCMNSSTSGNQIS